MTMYDLTSIDRLRRPGDKRLTTAQINAMLSRPEGERTVATVVHEATHQMAFNCGLHTRYADIPVWVSEGIAMYFETLEDPGLMKVAAKIVAELRADVDATLELGLEGRRERASFTSWQLTSGGWLEPRPIVLQLDGSTLFGTSGGDRLRLAEGVSNVAFDYLLEPGADTKWVMEWISPVSAPLAVRVRVAGCGKRDAGCVDTLVFLIRERG